MRAKQTELYYFIFFLLFPLVAFIFPLVFMIVFSPIVLKFVFMENRPF